MINTDKILTIQSHSSEDILDFFYSSFDSSTELADYCKNKGIHIDRHTLQAFDERTNVNFHILERIFAERFIDLNMLSPRVELSIIEFIDYAKTLRELNFPRQNYKRTQADYFLYKSKGFSLALAESLNVSLEVIHGVLSFLQIELAHSSIYNKSIENALWQHVNDYILAYEVSISPGAQRLHDIISSFDQRNIPAFFTSVSGGVNAFPSWGVFALDLYTDVRKEYFQTLSPFHKMLFSHLLHNQSLQDLRNKLSQETGLLIKHQRNILYGLKWLIYGRPNPRKTEYEF